MTKEDGKLEIVDDEDPMTLTASDLKELKSLARMSRIAKFFIAFAIGAISLVGLPELLNFIKAHIK